MRKYHTLLITILIFLYGSLCCAQDSTSTDLSLPSEVKSSAFVNQKEVPLNRTVTFTVQIQWSGNLSRFEIEDFENPVVTNFDVVGTSSSNRVGEINGETVAVKEYAFTLQPKSFGMGYIEGVIIKYRDMSTGESSRLITNRLEVKVIDPVPEPGELRLPVFWIVGALIVILVGVFVSLYLRRKQEEQRRREEMENITPLEETYLQELKNSFDITSPEVSINETIAGVSRLFRRYLAEKYGIVALEATTDEVMASLQEKEVEERISKDASEILKTSDVVKFSGGSGDKAELQRVYTLVEDILERNLRTPLLSNEESGDTSVDADS